MDIIHCADAQNVGEDVIGGKAYGLAKLVSVGARVPPWCVLSSAVFQAFLDENALGPVLLSAVQGLSPADAHQTIERRAQRLQEAIETAPLSHQLESRIMAALGQLGKGPYAVRSSMIGEDSAEHSFAGQLESFLFQNSPQEVWQSIKSCWASGFSMRALLYRLNAGLPVDKIRVAVVIQRMVDGEVSGVIFTANPTNGRRDEVLLTAAWGQGEGVVSGLCNTDEFIWSHKGQEVGSKIADKDIQIVAAPDGQRGTIETQTPDRLRNQRCLSPEKVKEVCEAAISIAAALGRPQDIEWTLSENQIYFLQSRPITSLPVPPNMDGPRVIWDNSNIQESFNGVVSPLTFSFAERMYASVYGQTMTAMDIPRRVIERHQDMLSNMLGLIRGRVFYNINNWYTGLKLLPSFGRNKADMEKMMGLEDPVDMIEDEVLSFWQKLGRLPSMLKLLFKMKRAFRKLPVTVEEFHRSFWDAYERVDRNSVSTLSFSQLMTKLKLIETDILGQWHTPIINDFYVMMTNGAVSRFLHKHAGYDDPVAIQNALLAGEDGIESAMPTRILMTWAQDARSVPGLTSIMNLPDAHDSVRLLKEQFPEFALRLDDYIERYGDRMMGEQKLEETSLRQDPSFLISVLRNYMAMEALDPHKMLADEKALRESAESQVQTRLNFWTRIRFNSLINQYRQAVKNRENMRMNRSRMFGLLRDVCTALGHRLHEANKLTCPQDIFYLTVSELESYYQGRALSTQLDAIAQVRKNEFTEYEKMDIPHHFETIGPVYHGNIFQYHGDEHIDADAQTLQGTGCYPGIVESDIRLIFSPNDELSVNGKILVTVRTDPGWAPLFPTTNGLIVERGSTLSHSAVVARELGIPAIVGIPGLTSILNDGERVKMNGESGAVIRLDTSISESKNEAKQIGQ